MKKGMDQNKLIRPMKKKENKSTEWQTLEKVVGHNHHLKAVKP